jgi:hypothetical protein
MPVIECSCGMVMSITPADARLRCIRCGGAELHVIGRREQPPASLVQDQVATTAAFSRQPALTLETDVVGSLGSSASTALIQH